MLRNELGELVKCDGTGRVPSLGHFFLAHSSAIIPYCEVQCNNSASMEHQSRFRALHLIFERRVAASFDQNRGDIDTFLKHSQM